MTGPRASGFTLAELLVSLAIGATVSLAGMTFYVSTLEGRRAVDARLALEEHRWFAVQTLRRYLAQAGHRPLRLAEVDGPVLPIDSRAEAFPATADGWAAGEYLRETADGFAIRFRGASNAAGDADGSLSDCTGAAIGADELGEMRFAVADGRLVCTVDDVEVTLAGGEGDTRVDALDVRVGIDDDGDGAADRFADADAAGGVPETAVALVLELALDSERESDITGEAADETVVSIALRN